MTAIFLAVGQSESATRTLAQWDWDNHPLHLLVALPYMKQFNAKSAPYRPLSTILDSGAFTAWRQGEVIDIDALITESKSGRWDETVALDVIGDAEGSRRNAHYMRQHGSNAFPVFHYGEPWDLFEEYCSIWPRVGISCTSMRLHRNHAKGRATVYRWIEQCFARGWPHLFHSFGWVDKDMLSKFPFDTADASSWETGPRAFGRWQSFGANLSVRGSYYKVTPEVWHYLKLQRRLEELWAKELAPHRARWLGELAKRRTLYIDAQWQAA